MAFIREEKRGGRVVYRVVESVRVPGKARPVQRALVYLGEERDLDVHIEEATARIEYLAAFRQRLVALQREFKKDPHARFCPPPRPAGGARAWRREKLAQASPDYGGTGSAYMLYARGHYMLADVLALVERWRTEATARLERLREALEKVHAAQDQPVAVRPKLHAVQEQPRAVQEQPVAVRQKPRAVQEQPRAVRPKPRTVGEKPRRRATRS